MRPKCCIPSRSERVETMLKLLIEKDLYQMKSYLKKFNEDRHAKVPMARRKMKSINM